MNGLLFHSAGARLCRPTIFARLLASTLLVFLAAAALPAQTADDGPIRELITRLDRGETEAVRQQLPELVTKYQNHPGILYVQARVATDGIEAAKLYQSVLDNYPSSEWADDALYNLYQYYYAMGLYKTAELKMQQLRKEYPGSEHLDGKTSAHATTPGEGRPEPPPLSPPVAGDTAKAGPPGKETLPAEPAAKEEPVKEQSGRDEVAGGRIDPKGVPAGGSMPYTLQTGAFSTSENAQKQKAWFEELGYTAEITNRVRGGRSLYLVWVGSFPTAEEARKVLRDIQSRYNITPIVVER